jgi:hypothetical protein
MAVLLQICLVLVVVTAGTAFGAVLGAIPWWVPVVTGGAAVAVTADLARDLAEELAWRATPPPTENR